MWLRRVFFGWLFPAAFILPLWLLIGWGVFQAGGWAFVWVIFLAIPSVFVGQLALTLLVRARGTVRAQRAVSWWDVAGFTLWHGLTIACGFFNPAWFWAAFAGAVLVGIGLFWLTLRELLGEARPGTVVLRTTGPDPTAYIPPPAPPRQAATEHDVIVITERPPAS
ncbi:MAG TPA: MFS transporter permease [Microbacterium sp.]|uniref:MFS transporter permease n=1 Tax=Microbacterium sp. TaxID=51671 RepID=UPI002C780307|nr:MFS transporter permease [Microbacterium sp.]HWI30347.1 MFS transporter permease [Microbacterium sp.]